jgi:membrane protease YdiL (CAAX protease family)
MTPLQSTQFQTPSRFEHRSPLEPTSWLEAHPLIASIAITVLTAAGLQLTHVIGFQEWVAEIVGWNLSVRFLDFGFRMSLGVLVVLLLLPWMFGSLRRPRSLIDYLLHVRFTTGRLPSRTLAATGLSAAIMLTLLIGLALRFNVLRGDIDFVLENGRWFIVVLSLVPAIWEELAFRGLMLTTLQRRYRPWMAIAISAILFGLFHITNLLLRGLDEVLFEMIMAAGVGIAWGYVVVKTGSVGPAMVLHYVVNVSIGLLLEPDLGETAGAAIFGSLTIAYPLLTIAAVWWLYRTAGDRNEAEDTEHVSGADEPIAF